MREKTYVVVDRAAVADYLKRGYQASSKTADQVLDAAAWAVLPDEHRVGLIVLELEPELHRELNGYKRRIRVARRRDFMLLDVQLCECELIERDPESDRWTMCADTGADHGPIRVQNENLFENRGEALNEVRAQVFEAIEKHKEALRNLQRFYKENL